MFSLLVSLSCWVRPPPHCTALHCSALSIALLCTLPCRCCHPPLHHTDRHRLSAILMGVLGLWTIIDQAGAMQSDSSCSSDGGPSLPTRACTLLLAAQQLQHAQVQREQHSAAASSAAATVAAAVAVPPPSSPSPRRPRVLAVDLSVWLMEAHAISKGIQHAQQSGHSGAGAASATAGSSFGVPYAAPRKHYLVYLLARVSSFLRNNIRLIFVTDGRAPVLKSRLTTKENQTGGGSGGGGGGGSVADAAAVQSHRAKQNPLFAAQIRDCTRLLQLMDLPVLELERGEAEALCALLNARGACDGVLTTDGDAFLFGARSVLRNLEASSTNLQATVVDINNIHTHTGMDRHKVRQWHEQRWLFASATPFRSHFVMTFFLCLSLRCVFS